MDTLKPALSVPPPHDAEEGANVFASIPAESAYGISLSSNASKWPKRGKTNRLEPLCLPEISPSFHIEASSSIFTIGSCFARHIERALEQRGFQTPALRFSAPREELWAGTKMVPGILNKYTPYSMLNEIEFALGEDSGEKYLIPTDDGLYWDGQLHTTESVSLERGLERRQELRELYRNSIRQSPVVIITLGLVESWWDNEAKVYLNETVPLKLTKKCPERFQFEVLSPEKTFYAVERILQILHHESPNQKVLLTVSPIPLQRSFTGEDVVSANSYSKSVLRVAAEIVTRKFAHVDYYPSFESVTHSDRKLAWDDDLIHASKDIVAANVERMIRSYTS